MTDIRTLLRDAAPQPRGPLDVDALVARSPRRWKTWIASALAVAAVSAGVAGSGALSPAGESGTQVSTRRNTPTPAPDEFGGDQTAAGVAGGRSGSAGASATDGGSLSLSPAGEKGASTAPGPSESQAASAAGEGCRIDRAAERAVSLGSDGNGGLSAEETPSCSYSATRPGGYRGIGSFQIEIRRDGAVFRLSSKDGTCGAIGVIKAGDEVRVLLNKAANDPPEWYAEAGSDIGCV